MQLKEGRFGPYVTDGETNASLRARTTRPRISIERAADLLAERRAKDPTPKKRAAKKAPAKKTAAKKTSQEGSGEEDRGEEDRRRSGSRRQLTVHA